MLNFLIIAVVVLVGGVLMYPPLAKARLWRATITPLASIIGSGYLVIGPILHNAFGLLSPLVMAALCGGAYLFGAAIRQNIADKETVQSSRTRAEQGLETVASWALAFAYVISVAYYLNLFGEFGLSLTQFDDRLHARLLTSAAFLVILGVGLSYGFTALERLEQVAVGGNLAIIAGMLFALGWHFIDKASVGGLVVETPRLSGWAAVTLVFGLVVTVQGFEISRYLGDEYNAATRIRSMKMAQWISSAIYLFYISMLTYSFEQGEISNSETAIIQLMGIVAPILAVLLVAAALSAQFSAAVADTGGASGLFGELTGHRLKPKGSYIILVAAGLALTWNANVFDIISYASRAFAAYYGLQSAIAAISSKRQGHTARAGLFAALALLGAAITVFGVAVE